MKTNPALESLRKMMSENGISATVIPSADSHGSEYPADCFKLREYLTGFTGSAGTAVVTLWDAELWTDSRYFLQAEKELEGTGFDLHKVEGYAYDGYMEWLSTHLGEDERVAIDGRLFPLREFDKLRDILSKKDIRLESSFDAFRIWNDRPGMPKGKIRLHPIGVAGMGLSEKITFVREFLAQNQSESIFFDALDEIAYLLNLRGDDIAFNPVFYAWLLVSEDQSILFTDYEKLSYETVCYLDDNKIRVLPYHQAEDALRDFSCRSLIINPSRFSAFHRSLLPSNITVRELPWPVIRIKTVKNKQEIAAMKHSMLCDGVALVQFYRRLENDASALGLDEFQIGEMLALIHAQKENYLSESFAPIVGFRENGAIVHYSPKAGESKAIDTHGMLLIDSGAQYIEGTTDITRCLYFGIPSEEEKKAYTLVLKAHIALEQAVFPAGTKANRIDALAREILWKHGMDYGHGTGHGVGAALSVHEGPVSFGADIALERGMIITDEPGYYKEGAFGIRLENCLLVVEKFISEEGKQFLGFEPLTLAPFEAKLVERSLLTASETQWLKEYHQYVSDTLLPHLQDGQDKAWLTGKCRMFE